MPQIYCQIVLEDCCLDDEGMPVLVLVVAGSAILPGKLIGVKFVEGGNVARSREFGILPNMFSWLMSMSFFRPGTVLGVAVEQNMFRFGGREDSR